MASLSTAELRLVSSRIYAQESRRVAAELSCSVPRVLVAGSRKMIRQRTAQLVSEVWGGLHPVIAHAASEREALSFDVKDLWVAILHDERGAFDAIDIAMRHRARSEHAEFVICRAIGSEEDLERMYCAGLRYCVRETRLPHVLPHVLRSIEYRREILPTAVARHRTAVTLCAEYGEDVAAAAGFAPPPRAGQRHCPRPLRARSSPRGRMRAAMPLAQPPRSTSPARSCRG